MVWSKGIVNTRSVRRWRLFPRAMDGSVSGIWEVGEDKQREREGGGRRSLTFGSLS